MMAISSGLEFKFTDNSAVIKESTEKEIIAALQACGVQAQGHATAEITAVDAIETGRLKASITFAVSGDSARQYTYTAENSGETFTDPIEGAGESKDHTLYLGTNVEYAPYVEMGTSKMPARPFIRPAVENYLSEYEQIFLSTLSKIGK